MEALIIIFYLGVLIFYIWMVCLFVGISKNIRDLRDTSHQQDLPADWDLFQLKNRVRIAILTDSRKQLYDDIIKKLSNEIYHICSKNSDGKVLLSIKSSDSDNPYYRNTRYKAVDAKIPGINNCLKEMGMELPSELQSVEAYVKFYNSQPSETSTN